MSEWQWANKGYLTQSQLWVEKARSLGGGDLAEAKQALQQVRVNLALAEANIEFKVNGEWVPLAADREPTARLDHLVGLESVKREVRQISDRLRVDKIRRDEGKKVTSASRHLVFTGNPGTGKTTVARILGEIYKELGVISKGHVIEVDRSGLVGQYQGHTAEKVRTVVKSALGGILFVDEAYALVNGEKDNFGKEAIDALIKLMEDHRGDLVVIAAGYTDDMKAFLGANPGMQSRFAKTIHFPDYSNDELVRVLERYCAESGVSVDERARELVVTMFATIPRDPHFGNARDVRKLFEQALDRQATRLMRSGELKPESRAIDTLRAVDFVIPDEHRATVLSLLAPREARGKDPVGAYEPNRRGRPKELKPGDRVSGRVTSIADFGAFVYLGPSLRGLIPTKYLEGHIPAKGSNVDVEVVAVDPAGKIRLRPFVQGEKP